MRLENWIYTIPLRLRSLFHRSHLDAELNEELRDHIERQIEFNQAREMSAEQARLAALRAFGNFASAHERTRATWSWSGLEQLVRDGYIGARTLGRSPGFALIAILIMAIGIGANVTLFTVVRGVLLKPLPFEDPDRLLMLYESESMDRADANSVAGGLYAEWKGQNHSFTSLALMQPSRVGLSASGGQLPEKLYSAVISWDLLPTLGVQPSLGRDFTRDDDSPSANGTVLLSWGLWKRRFGGNRAIVNQSILIDSQPYTIIGVMPSWFNFPDSSTQLWTPVYHDRPESVMNALSDNTFRVVGRLKPGVSAAQASAELAAISQRVHNAHLDDPFIFNQVQSKPLLEHLVGNLRTPLYVLLAATGCVLLIACLNLANLLVARGAARRREFAIRTALGGGWLRLVRERLIESLLLSAAGGALGLSLAGGVLTWLVHARTDVSRVESIHIDGAVAFFTAGIVVLCALLSGLVSAFGAGSSRILMALQEGSRAASPGQARARLRRVLLSVEVALTVVLLIGAGLLLKSYQRLRSNDMGCLTENILTMHFGLPDARYKPADRVNFYDRLLERVRGLPGVVAAGFVEAAPGQGYFGDSSFTVVEHPYMPLGKGQSALNRWADPKYFAAIGIPFRRGRTFNPNLRLDHADEVVVSQSFVDRFLPNEEPLGKHIHTNDRDFVIVGVVGDTRNAIGEEPRPIKYFSLESGDLPVGTLVLRSNRNVEQFALRVEHIAYEMDPDLPVSDILTMDQLLGVSTIDRSFNATLLVAFAALSLLQSAVGLFGVMSYLVAQRTTEMGIRIALGAQRANVLGLMLMDGMRPALAGLVIGLAAGVASSQLLRSMLYRTQALDPAVFLAGAVVLFVVAFAACMLPSWRASRLDPMRALRME